jgi:hypothetical protein
MENTMGQPAERVKGMARASEKPVWATKPAAARG